MPLWGQVELLCRAVAEEGRKEAEAILAQARAEADQLLSDAERRAEREAETVRSARRRDASLQARHRVDSAELEAKKAIMALRDRILREVFDTIGERLKRLREEHAAAYEAFLTGAFEEAVGRLQGRHFVVEVNGKDLALQRERLERKAGELSVAIEIEPCDAFEGGVRVTTSDRRMRYDNSVEARLERSREAIRQEIWRVILGIERSPD